MRTLQNATKQYCHLPESFSFKFCTPDLRHSLLSCLYLHYIHTKLYNSNNNNESFKIVRDNIVPQLKFCSYNYTKFILSKLH